MWLALDIGNTDLKAGFFDSGGLVRTKRIATHPDELPAVMADRLMEVLDSHTIERIGIASVVPVRMQAIQAVLQQRLGVPVQIVHHMMRLPFELHYRTPHTLGTDRLAAAAAAWQHFGSDAHGAPRSVVAIDAGTAVTYEVIHREGAYLGGAIGAGPGLVRKALHSGTAQLPVVDLDVPEWAVGGSTTEAIQAGILFGFLDGVAGMLRRIREQLGEAPYVVVTGGWHRLLADHLLEINRAEPDLVLLGIHALLQLNPVDFRR